MSRVEDYHYRVSDSRNVTQGYFATEGLAHQYLLSEYPWPEDKRTPKGKKKQGYASGSVINCMPSTMFVKRVKRKH